MSFISKIFGSNKIKLGEPILVDIHSHLLPGIDDGVQSLDEAYEIIKIFQELGYKKLITTPHIHTDHYKNNPEIIHAKLKEVQNYILQKGLVIKLEAAAEYYLDENFLSSLDKGIPLLTFGDNFLLFETSYINEPVDLEKTIFKIKSCGYWPILAHPERYTYLYHDFTKYKEIYDLGISFQININSLTGYYSKPAEQIALKLLEHEMINFVGSDCHGRKHLEALKKTLESNNYQKLLNLSLLNNSLLP